MTAVVAQNRRIPIHEILNWEDAIEFTREHT